MLADFILSREPLIRAIARGKMKPGAKGVIDSEDVVSSVLRRVDALARAGTLQWSNENELWGLVKAIASNYAISSSRLTERVRYLGSESPEAAPLTGLLNCGTDDEANVAVYQMAASIGDPVDRQIFLLRLRGAGHKAVAAHLHITEGAAKQRWSRLCRGLRDRFPKGPE